MTAKNCDARGRGPAGQAIWIGLLLALIVIGAGFPAAAARAQQAGPLITTPTPTPSPTPRPLTLRERLLLTPEAQRRGQIAFLPLVLRAADRAVTEAPAGSFTYTVRPGDTFWTLALDFGRDLDTMACATSPLAADVEALIPGQQITVPALRDLCYTVTPGDTLEGIAQRHGLTVAAIVALPWNGLKGPTDPIVPRQRILLPGARPDARPRPDHHQVSVMADDWAQTPYRDWPYGDGHFIWPVVGPISQGAHEGHWALDIAVPEGTPVRAADRGRVVMAGWSPVGYGFRVVIDHGNDYLTLYAHLRDIYVEKGQVVGKGQTLGVSGSNGNITGPHLHFEIRDFGVLIDPRLLLP
ncbi:MAG: peptidoglycan DD-metalloendopeptidase family protein [Anaerolineae bacterium]